MKRFCLIFIAVILSWNISYADCFSDYDCGIGARCVKAYLNNTGTCMKSVDEYGTQQYNMPNPNSVFMNLNPQGQCNFDTDCPVGFACHSTYKVCIKR